MNKNLLNLNKTSKKYQYYAVFGLLFSLLLSSCSAKEVKDVSYKSISISAENTELLRNESLKINLLLDNKATSNTKDITCISSDPTIASIINYKIYGLNTGTVKIACTTSDLVSNVLDIKIIDKTVTIDDPTTETPTEPTDPTNPTDPVTPTDPTDPVIPTEPTTPGNLLVVSYIDVGQGDSILIQTPNGKTILLDAGPSTYQGRVSDYLDQEGISKIDVLIASHPHADHIGGMSYIINNYEIGSIYMPKAVSTTKTYETLLETIKSNGLTINTAKAGITINIDKSIEIKIIAPTSSSYSDLNQYSAVIKITYNKVSYLFMGDAGWTSEDEILSSGVNIKADVLKVGHHGSATSSTQEFLDEVLPTYAVICVGEDNTYGHPTEQTLDRLDFTGADVYRTDQDGTVVISTNGQTITIE
ncbi:MAG: MBL fold metallo-hydrolase [Erysipelotrichaceae bacterium]|nr:MBL fold metallo-hydrolase [Erysipelotrichaceae bacterium]